ncbi:MAG: NAD(P)-dependent oxidoreductase [Planctomycetota bacterium]
MGGRKKRVLSLADVSGPIASATDALERLAFEGKIELFCPNPLGELADKALEGFDAVITRPGSAVILPKHVSYARKPLCVATLSVGTSHLTEIMKMEGVNVLSAKGTNAEGTATLGLMLGDLLLRPVQLGCEQMGEGTFDRRIFDTSRRPDGLEWIVFGGGHVVRSMLWGIYSRNPKQITVVNRTMNPAKLEELISDFPTACCLPDPEYTPVGWCQRLIGKGNRELPLYGVKAEWPIDAMSIPSLEEADIVSLNIDCNAATMRFCDRSLLESMKRGAVLINMGRGELVDENVVLEALESRHLGGYAADVLCQQAESERHPRFSPIWARYLADKQLPIEKRLNMILTPHVGGHVLPDIKETASQVVNNLIEQLGV